MYWLILHLIWRMISCWRMSLKKWFRYKWDCMKLCVSLTWCQTTLNFEVGSVWVGGLHNPDTVPKVSPKTQLDSAKVKEIDSTREKKEKQNFGQDGGLENNSPFCCITGTTMSVQFGSGDEKKISSCCFLKIKPHIAFLAGSENNFTFLLTNILKIFCWI